MVSRSTPQRVPIRHASISRARTPENRGRWKRRAERRRLTRRCATIFPAAGVIPKVRNAGASTRPKKATRAERMVRRDSAGGFSRAASKCTITTALSATSSAVCTFQHRKRKPFPPCCLRSGRIWTSLRSRRCAHGPDPATARTSNSTLT